MWSLRGGLIALVVLATSACAVSSETSLGPSSAPAPGSPGSSTASESVTFAAAADFSASPSAREVLASMGMANLDLALALGDLSYGHAGEEGDWCTVVTDGLGAGFPFELVSGNHESNGQNGRIEAFADCLPNQLPGLDGEYARQYFVDVPAENPLVRFILISPALPFDDGEWSYARNSPLYAWTASAIDAAHAAEIPWVVVGMHKPCLTLGRYECDPGEDIMNLLIDKRVDLVLNGHEHLYQRTAQLATSSGCPRLSATTTTRACIADANDVMIRRAGTVFVTVGTGGAALRDVTPTPEKVSYFASWSGKNSDPTHGFLNVAVTPSSLTATFHPIASGQFRDQFAIYSR